MVDPPNKALSLFTDGNSTSPSVLNSVLLSGISSSCVWPTMCTGGGRGRGAEKDTPESEEEVRGEDIWLEESPPREERKEEAGLMSLVEEEAWRREGGREVREGAMCRV